ncbi:hypothetical protein [Nonomuraea endophytica]|uniref:Glycosyltransferase RgtA/B/C/D-like domain-containing protein n=1 Tax=Nonomuraea endophytica TaxID=714136 RepID=A0A7W8A6K7_9ACTN|nr:hypothetical protein [Nonomuraea endophytica]MBB5080567.1 hypothetical protein [Nonomuraea endophytica]
MQTSVIDRPVAGPAPVSRSRPARLPWLLAGGWLAHLLLRLWLYRYHAGPVANPDEVGYLLAARWLAGGPGGDYSGSTFYQGGYPLLLAPVYWLSTDPVTVYRLVSGFGAVASASAFPLAYLVLRRLALGRRAALALAFVAGLAPSLLLFSGLALVDAVLPTLVLGWLVAFHDLVNRRGVVPGVVAGALSGLAMAMHMRGAILFGVFVVGVLGVLVFRRVSLRAGLWALGAAALAGGAGMLVNARLKAALYPSGIKDLSGLALERVTGLEGQARSLAGAAGQIWYLVTATWGVAGIGIVAALVVLVRRGGSPYRVMAGILLALTLGIAYASSAALPDEHRVGNYAYGRYLACVAVAWTLVGLVALLRSRRRTALALASASAGLLALSGGLAAWYAGDRLTRYTYIAFDFPEAAFLSGVRDRFDLVGASVAALVLLAAITAASLVRTKTPIGRKVAGALVLAFALAVPNVAFAADIAPKSAPARGNDGLPRLTHGRVGLDTRVKWNIWVHLIHRVHWTEVERVRPSDGPLPEGLCTVVAAPEAGAPPAGWTVSGRGQGWVTWTAC